jgi:transcriptional regulator with XRE-family HTH domain|tara:strand:+ start:434 stop:751 length:318 start_codon:yes stop_codon:yes gene_type:complete
MDKSPIHKPTFVREWRKFRRMTLDDLSTAACIDKGNLSKMERGLLQYNQETLERLAAALKTDTASLIERDPTDNPPIWTMWDKANREQRRQIEGVVAALIGAKVD